jgi:hypothetical protein
VGFSHGGKDYDSPGLEATATSEFRFGKSVLFARRSGVFKGAGMG